MVIYSSRESARNLGIASTRVKEYAEMAANEAL